MVTPKKRRFRYTSVACERCQQRKTRCTGEQPCKGCQNACTECLYPRATRYRSSRCVSARGLSQEARAVQTEQESLDEEQESVTVLEQNWPLEILGSELASGNFDDFIRLTEHQLFQASQQSNNPSANHGSDGFVSRELHILFVQGDISPRRVLEALDGSFWSRVLQIYEEEVGLMYPFLDIDQLSHVILERKRRCYFESLPSNSLYGEGVAHIAFLVLAIVSSFEGSKAVEIANSVVEEAFVSTIPKIHLQSPSLSDLTLLVLICIFFFLNDREKEAWRIMGSIMRLVHEQSCQEEETPAKTISDTFFWSLYTLDRRWSFGTGLPFALQDSEIIRQPLPTDSSSHPLAYLKAMVSFCSIASDVRSFFLGTLASGLQDSGDYLQFRVIQWQQNLPHRLQFNGINDKLDVTAEKRGYYKLRLMLYLRANQMRTIILRKAATRFGSNNIDTSNFQVMIQVARDSIQVLASLARKTDIYHAQHKTFNHFLETALSSLLLVTCYAHSDQSKSCLEDVVTGTQLVHRLAKESLITRRLRDKLQSIRKATDELRSQRCMGSTTEKGNSMGARDRDIFGSMPSSGTMRVDQDSGSVEADANSLAADTTDFAGVPVLSNGASTTLNIPIGLFDLDSADATWGDTDPALFTNLSQILGNCESFVFF